jgi:hypothetical protein
VSNLFGVNQTLELLDNLKRTVAEFAAREEKLNRDFAAAVSAERQRRDKAIEQLNERLAESTADTNANFQTQKESLEARQKARKTWIAKAHKNSQKLALERIGDLEGRRKHKLQTATMQMHRDHDSGKANAEKVVVEFKTSLAQEKQSWDELEIKTREAFKGFGKFKKLLSRSQELPESDLGKNEYDLIAELDALLIKTREEVGRFGKMLLPKLFKHRVALSILTLCLIPLVPILQQFGNHEFTYRHAGIAVGAIFVFGFILHFVAQKQAGPLATTIANAIVRARRMHDICFAKSDSRLARENERVENEFKDKNAWIESEWKKTLEESSVAKESTPQQVEEKFSRVVSTNDTSQRRRWEKLESDHKSALAKITGETESKIAGFKKVCEDSETKLNAEFQSNWNSLEVDWKKQIEPLYAAIRRENESAEKVFPDWNAPLWKNWKAPEHFESAAKFAELEVDVEKLSGAIPKDTRLALPNSKEISLPLALTFPQQGSLLLETKGAGHDEALATLNNIFLRILSVAPPGKVAFTVIDPVGLGQNFAGVMHLADFAEHLINGRIWTQSGQIEEKLAEINEHMEKVIQMYLRNEYATIAEYNEQAGNIAEKYHFLVVANFPANFTDTAVKRLLSIANTGARCGVYSLIHWDHTQPEPTQFVPDELRKSSVNLVHKGNRFVIAEKSFPRTNLLLDAPPAADFVTEFIQKVGQSSRDSNRVEVPFSHVAPPDAQLWSEETTSELRVPIGRTGATKFQYLAIGKGTKQHALVAGKTGSGKSTLFHVIITNLALWCSPDEVEFYLIDFKKGVEFKCYAEKKLPHAKVVAIESDREFGLSVLQRIDAELKRRGDLFRALGVQDLAGYKKAGGKEPMPRSLLIIDEFQEFFTEDDKVSQGASVLLDRIVRQGRAFGIHVLLGSQTLGGAYTMARTTIGQMVIRIALQCNEADAYLIMDDDNPAPRLLSRPGEGIYNDAAGNILGNSPFQAVWLPDDVRDSYLDKVREQAEKSGRQFSAPIVFEGDAPADVRENALLENLLRAEAIQPTQSPRIWLGAPNSIKGPTEAVFQKQSGNNLLFVGQRDDAILSILSIGLVSLAAQFPAGKANFILFDGNPPGSTQREFLEKIVQSILHKITVARPNEISEVMNTLAADLKQRGENPASDAPATFLFIHGLQKFAKLRNEDEFSFSSDDSDTANPATQLSKLITEGPALGIHVVATFDTYNNVNRFLSKKAFSEFEMRVLFQMSANDSASLIDNPRAGSLGLHRALFYNEQQGYLELFRPYALPQEEWIREAAEKLKRLW